MTREDWLNRAVQELRDSIFPSAEKVPAKMRVSVGFPSTRSTKQTSRAIGECWDGRVATDNVAQLFISPTLNPEDGARILDVLCHEMIHATVGCDAGHKGAFKRLATLIGLEGKMTATVAGESLRKNLAEIAIRLGEFPHAQLKPGERPGKPKQGTRLIKLLCDSCGYTARTTQKWLDVGLPVCPCGSRMSAPEADAPDGED